MTADKYTDESEPNDRFESGFAYPAWEIVALGAEETHKKNSMQSGLLPLKAKYKGGNIIITFRYEGNGLQMPDGERVSGFSLDDMTDVPAALNARQLYPLEIQACICLCGQKPFLDSNYVIAGCFLPQH